MNTYVEYLVIYSASPTNFVHWWDSYLRLFAGLNICPLNVVLNLEISAWLRVSTERGAYGFIFIGYRVNSRETRNFLLKKLPQEVADTLLRSAEFVHFDLRDRLSEPNVDIENVHFPESGVISVLLEMEDQSLIEIATVGNEGMLGLPLAMGLSLSQELVFCQVTGSAWSVPAHRFRELVEKYPSLKNLCDRYSMVFFDQVARNAACARSHDTRKRCARWLLQTQDRCQDNEFVLTQEFLALMLNVSRTSVNIAASSLAKDKLVTYVRGKVKVLDRTGLEAASCACYTSMRDFSNKAMNN